MLLCAQIGCLGALLAFVCLLSQGAVVVHLRVEVSSRTTAYAIDLAYLLLFPEVLECFWGDRKATFMPSMQFAQHLFLRPHECVCIEVLFMLFAKFPDVGN